MSLILNIGGKSNQKLTKCVLFGFTTLSVYGGFYYTNSKFKAYYNQQSVALNSATNQPCDLSDQEHVAYPWFKPNGIENWENKLVKMRGYFKEERFFVRREKNGKQGYLVFAPFVTAVKQLSHNPSAVNPNAEVSIMVDLGWVPLENKDDIEMGNQPIEPLTEDQVNFDSLTENVYTELQIQHEENPEEEEMQPLTEIIARVKKGEKQNILRGRVNWEKEGVFQFIDLKFMSKFFRFSNLDSGSEAYLERFVLDLDNSDDSETLYPVPASIDDCSQSTEDFLSAQKYQRMFLLSGVVGGLALLKTVLRK